MKTEKLEIRISPEEKDMLREIAMKQDVSMSQLVRQLIKDYVRKSAK